MRKADDPDPGVSHRQYKKLTALAKALGVTKADLIRQGVDLILREKVRHSPDPLLDLIGQAGQVGRSDISARHDDYLAALSLQAKND